MSMSDWTAGLQALNNSINYAASTIAAGADTKKKIRYARQQQQILDRENYERAIEKWNMENEYNEQMYLKYQTPEAQRRMLEEAGYNPEIFASGGSTGGISSAGIASGGGSSLPSVPTQSFNIPNFADDLMRASAQVEELAKARDERLSRRYDIEARRIENNRKELEYMRELMDSSEDANRLKHESWKRGQEYGAADRIVEAHDMAMKEARRRLTYGVNEEFRRQASFVADLSLKELQYWLSNENLTEQQWRRQYRERYGRNPERNETLGDFLFKLGEDVGFLDLVREVGQPASSSISPFKEKLRNTSFYHFFDPIGDATRKVIRFKNRFDEYLEKRKTWNRK